MGDAIKEWVYALSLHQVYRKNVKKIISKIEGKDTKAWIEGVLVAM